MKHGSLFSGIGGPDLAAQWMGWENVMHCEINPFGRRVLNHYWPNATSYEDITTTDFTIHRGQIDVLTGGFPCQPYSTAGLRKGKEDERHLWPQMLRAIREIKPTWVVGENVLGLVNWNGGLVFEEVQADLEAEGYEVQPYVLPAAGVDAPHQRYRVWFVAYSTSSRRYGRRAKQKTGIHESDQTFRTNILCQTERLCCKRFASDTNGGQRREGGVYPNRPEKAAGHAGSCDPRNARPTWDNFPTQSPVCTRNDGLSAGLDGITFSKWRNESIKAAGNAIVPQVIYQIFQAIELWTKDH